jgi:hypothetical protein
MKLACVYLPVEGRARQSGANADSAQFVKGRKSGDVHVKTFLGVKGLVDIPG